MADEPTPRPGIRVLDLSTPRPPGDAPPPPAPEPETPAVPVPRGPAPVVGQPVDLSTGKPPSRSTASRTNNPQGLRVVVQKTINLSTPKAEKRAAAPADDGAPRSRRGTRPEAQAPDGRRSQNDGRKRGAPKGGAKGGQRGGPKGNARGSGRSRDDNASRDGGASRGEAPRSASTGLADFLDPETLKRLRGE